MKIQLENMDCLEFISTLLRESIDLVYCDLPYGTTQCSWDSTIDLEKMWYHVNRIVKDFTPIVFHAAEPYKSTLVLSNPVGFKFDIVWEKSKATGFLNAKKRPLVAHESLVVFGHSSPEYYPQMEIGLPYNKGVRKAQTGDDVYGKFNQVEVKSNGLRYPRSVVYFKTAESEGKTFHKSQKPLALAEYVIKTFSKEGDTVLDFTMGSGTSGVAAKKLNRNYIGVEDKKEIFEIAKKRINES